MMPAAATPTTDAFVRLNAECPVCGKREARKIAKWRIALYQGVNPETVCDMVICKAGHEYYIKASAYQGAA